ncbi:MAG: type II toxin-antitoxin system prevent-host-death family antitoxin [Gammaproteobacteria bacterium]|nr:type II toxin-antitoxin system prevent-host-death family antitoxin [Gammaproteobacteria bacterium]
MKSVSVTELKAHLSKYLREVRRGGEIQVLERGVPVARLTQLPASSEGRDDEADRQRLIRAGILRPGSGDLTSLLQDPPIMLRSSLCEALEQDREDRV